MWVAILHFRDAKGAEAEFRFRPSPLGGYDAALSYAMIVATAVESVSTAYLYKLEMRQSFPVNSQFQPLPTSNVERVGILLYRNGDEVSSIYLPSISRLLSETGGAYSGRRITRASLQLQGMLAHVDNLLQGALDAAGRPYGSTFSVGCVTGES